MRNAGRVLSRPMLVQHVWGLDFDSESNVVDVYVGYLRRRIDGSGERKLLHTVRGAGYVAQGRAVKTRCRCAPGSPSGTRGCSSPSSSLMSVAAYSFLRWSLLQQVDASLFPWPRVSARPTSAAAGRCRPRWSRPFATSWAPGSPTATISSSTPRAVRASARPPPALPLSGGPRQCRAGPPHLRDGRGSRGDRVRLLTVPSCGPGRASRSSRWRLPLAGRDALSGYLTTLLALVPVAGALGRRWAASLVTGGALRPVADVPARAQITAEDLGRRLARRGTEDEIDHLADTLNTMLAGLEAAFGQTQPLLGRRGARAAHAAHRPQG